MFTAPDAKPKFAEMEEVVLKWWKEQNILEKSIQGRDIENSKTFYDGPITANGKPHYGHVMTFAVKDIIPRYWTMKGYRVDRSLGWDCQGIPVEYEVEKELGFTEKKDIEEFGIAKFNQLCRESVTKFRSNIVEMEERMGRLTNADEEYATMDSWYIESVWWSLSQLYEKDLLYEGFKVVPYSTRAGTSLSNAEVALGGYEPFTDPAITVEFPLDEDPTTMVLAWTTTPWTMPGNLGLAVGEDMTYVKVKSNDPKKTYVLAKDLLDEVFGDDPYEVVEEFKGKKLVGKKYLPPFDSYKGHKNAHQIYAADFVTTDSGTGIVHLAPYGAEDNELFQEVGIESFDYLDDQGDFTNAVAEYEGQNYRDANPKIMKDLEEKDRLFASGEYTHDMPMCWRTKTPLIYKPITSWYIAMSTLRKQLLENNDKVTWVPEHVKEGRFGNWLAEIKDWGISRLRYWGTPLPVWKSDSGKVKMISSFDELEKLSGVKIDDPHRPYVDEISFEIDGEEYNRVPDVIDVWYDSGSMPFARFHYPFENKEKFKQKFPADFIGESMDQTRGWFYSLMAISTALLEDTSFKAVIVNGMTLDDEGRKQSKSSKNYEPPGELIDKLGADALRMNYFSSPITMGENTTISEKTVKVHVQEFLLPLWNSFKYLVTYANIHEWESTESLVGDKLPKVEGELDIWILTKLQETIELVTDGMEQYKLPRASRPLYEFLNELSKWYIRRSRDRFAAGDPDALQTLYYCLVQFAKLAAPFTPFVTEGMYQTLVAELFKEQPESIHLCDYPIADKKFLEKHQQNLVSMKLVREIVELGQSTRATEGIKVRQPLQWVEFEASAELEAWATALVAAELNVGDVRQVDKLTDSKSVVVSESPSGVRTGTETELTPELVEAGLVREITRTIQAQRKKQGFAMGEKVKVVFDADDKVIAETVENNMDEIKETVSATEIKPGKVKSDKLKVNQSQVGFEITKA